MSRCPHCGLRVGAETAAIARENATAELEAAALAMGIRIAPGGFLELKDAARLVNRHPRTLRRWIEQGLPGGDCEDLIARKVGGRLEVELRSLGALVASECD